LILAIIAAAFLVQWRRNVAFSAITSEAKSSTQPVLDRQSAKSQTSSPKLLSEPFQWSRLESRDYRTYIANLRAIGCPEQTIRDIITADVHALCAQQSKADRAMLDEPAVIEALLGPQSSRVSPGANVTQMPRSSAVQRLQVPPTATESATSTPLASKGVEADAVSPNGRQPQGETGEVQPFQEEPGRQPLAAALTGATVSQMPLDTTARRNQVHPPTTENPVSIPTAFASVDASAAASLSEQQLAAIRDVQQQFRDEVGEPNQDTSDPAYRQQWDAAQRDADQMLAAHLGWPGYLEYLMQTGSHFQQTP
jgi:hypothetical protein